MDPLTLLAGIATLAAAGALVRLDGWLRNRAWQKWDDERAVELAAWRADWLVGDVDLRTVPTSEQSPSLYAVLGEPVVGCVPVSEIWENPTLSLSPREHLG